MSRTVVDGSYDFEYLPTGQKVMECVGTMKTPNICFGSGFGGGKTRQVCEISWNLGVEYPKMRAAHFRKTRVSLKDTAYTDFQTDVVPPEYIADHSKGELRIKLINGSQYGFWGIDNFERKGSMFFDLIVVHEANELTMEDIIMLEGRLRAHVLPLPMMLYETNAGMPGMPLHKMFVANAEKPERQQDSDYAYFAATSYENFHNPPSYFKRLEKWKGTRYYDRYVLNEWKSFEGVIYSPFDEKIHVIPPFEIPSLWPKYVAVDFGFSVEHALVFLWIARDPRTGIDYIYRQYYRTEQLIRHAGPKCKEITEQARERILDIIGDHDAENRAQLETDWRDVTPAVKTTKAGIQDVFTSLLPLHDGNDTRGMYIFNNDWSERKGFCYGLIERDPLLEEKQLPTCIQEEFPKYIWGKDDMPIKNYDHGLDAYRYLRSTLKKLQEEGTEISVATRPGRSRR